MQDQQKPSEQESDESIIEQIATELVDLRMEHERRVGRILARLNFRARQREKARKAQAAQGGAK